MSFNLLPKQVALLEANADRILYGGGRGGAKTFGTTAAAAIEPIESYSEEEVRLKKIDVSDFRVKIDEDGSRIYYKFLIDYPYYNGVIVRRSLPQLVSNTLVENKKLYPLLGGKYTAKDSTWTFPSGATITLRPLNDEMSLDFFQGPSFQRFIVEELTQFDQHVIEQAEACCRSAEPIGGGTRIPAKIIYTTNPGGRGHKWVKEEYVDKCPPLPDGKPVYVEEYDLSYQPLKANVPYVSETGERILFIPSLVFDNPYLADNDKRYVSNLLNKNKILRDSWLFGKWDTFSGQFFDMWDENIHVIDEMKFYNVNSLSDVQQARQTFDWKEKGYALYLSNDYGVRNPWACGFYAVDQNLNIIKFAEIFETGMSINQQARYTKEFLKEHYNLEISDFTLAIADPKSYWETRDKATGFYTFADEYAKEGILLTKGNNTRLQGAGAMLEALRIRGDGTPRLRFLSNCENTISSIPSLPSDPKNPDDVDSNANDHCYDEMRYFLMVTIGAPIVTTDSLRKKTWRDNLKPYTQEIDEDVRAYLTA
jgi:hypothetical protein